jgi:Malectin domain
MKSVALIFAMATMATNIIAFEQMYAVNSGGEAHTDSDGIEYQKIKSVNPANWSKISDFDFGNVPVSDLPIYRTIDRSYHNKPPIQYNISVQSDGLYVLIAKFSYGDYNNELLNMSLNNEIQLLPNVDLRKLCGGPKKICDEYFYLCVVENTLYYGNKSSAIQHEEILIKIHSAASYANIAGLVLLKGDLGEQTKLKSSATNRSLDFNPKNMHPKCLSTASLHSELQKFKEEERQNSKKLQTTIETIGENCLNNVKNSCDCVREKSESTKAAIESVQEQQSKSNARLHETLDDFKKKNREDFLVLNHTIYETMEKKQEQILYEIQNFQNQTIKKGKFDKSE